MVGACKKWFIIGLLVSCSLGITDRFVYGYAITLDAVEDAGFYPGQEAYLRFTGSFGQLDVPATGTQWTTKQEFYQYASENIPGDWLVESAGNIWSTTDTTVGETLDGLPAGIYHISNIAGSFQYDSFGWSPFAYQSLWVIDIRAQWDNTDQYYTLGIFDPSIGSFSGISLDVPLGGTGSLSFWIKDKNSIDNSGSLMFDVARIPEPSSLILLSIGLAFLARRRRS
jgi:hypothetical protein